MRWLLRVVVALTFSALAVALLTWAGWPRPRFTATLPKMIEGSVINSWAIDRWNYFDSNILMQPSETAPWPWCSFSFHAYLSDCPPGRGFISINLADGRVRGPWIHFGIDSRHGSSSTDCKGAAIVTKFNPSKPIGGGSIGRIDPETGAFVPITEDRNADFIVSENGETMLTFSIPVHPNTQDTGTADLLCYDLRTEPPTPTRIELSVPKHRLYHQLSDENRRQQIFLNTSGSLVTALAINN